MKYTWKITLSILYEKQEGVYLNDGKAFFLIATRGSCQVIIDTKK
jgi:hypothetical protein